MRCIQLASNESPFGTSPRALEAMQSALTHCHLYPDNNACELQEKLAERHYLKPEQVLIGAGSTELVGILARTLLKPGLRAVTSERSFIVYTLATNATGAELIQVPMTGDSIDLEAVAQAVTPDTQLIFLANPNNPTGTAFNMSATDRFLAQIRSDVTIVLDEAYFEYADYFSKERSFNYSRSLDYVRKSRNVVVLRTFSKVHGLAAVRIGYALGPADLLSRCAEMRSTYSISLPAQAGALAALDDKEHVQQAVTQNAAGARWLSERLSDLGYKPVQTWGNFIYCDIRQDAEKFAQHMEAEGVYIRPLGSWGASEAIRVTIGTEEQNNGFLDAFRAINKLRV